MGVFATAGAVRDWIEAPWGVAYTVAGVYTLLQRLRIRLKTPRPRHTKADPQGPGGLEKGGLAERLAAAGLKAGQGIVWGDERRVGLRGQVGKVGPRAGWQSPKRCRSAGSTSMWRSPSIRGRGGCGGRGSRT